MREQQAFKFGVSKEKKIRYFLLKAKLERETIFGIACLYIFVGFAICFQQTELMMFLILCIPVFIVWNRIKRKRVLCEYLRSNTDA